MKKEKRKDNREISMEKVLFRKIKSNVKCGCCKIDIAKHNKFTAVSCLAYLTGLSNELMKHAKRN